MLYIYLVSVGYINDIFFPYSFDKTIFSYYDHGYHHYDVTTTTA